MISSRLAFFLFLLYFEAATLQQRRKNVDVQSSVEAEVVLHFLANLKALFVQALELRELRG